MTSPRQVKANRRNAQASTGPVSKSGKQKASQNALKHGLGVPANRQAATAKLVLDLMTTLMNLGEACLLASDALELAQAEVDILRARQARSFVMDQLLSRPPTDTSRDLGQQLARLDRYERRALSRRKALIRTIRVSPP
jgi:hypothetical protein